MLGGGTGEHGAVPKKIDRSMLPQAIQFSQQLANAQLWLRTSEELLAAARLIEPEILAQWAEVETKDGAVVSTSGRTNVQGPYFVLIAYAIENQFKAYLVHRHRESLRNRVLSSIPGYISEHNLCTLANKSDFRFSKEEEDLFLRLTRNSIWSGRYPIPTSPDGASAVRQFSDGQFHLTAVFYPKDVDRLHDLLERIHSYVLDAVEASAD
jgi:hypothetical protein